MVYPVEILPNPAYKTIDCKLSQYYLLRFIDTADKTNILDPITNTIKLEYVYSPTVRVSDLSMNLLGIYKVGHIFIQFTKKATDKYMHECAPDETVNMPIYGNDYFLNENRHFWCIQLVHLANETFEFKSSEETITATCLVLHTPMRWNFWHFPLRWQLKEGLLEEMDEKQRTKIAKKLGHMVKSMIVKFATIQEPEHEVLPQHCYFKN